MPDLDYRFDEYTEQYSSRELERVREFARHSPLGDDVGIEIGCNRGRFLRDIAKRHPERQYLGVELRKKYARKAKKRVERHDLDNAFVIHGDANHVLPVVIDDGQLAEMFLLFPDPWWKTRHHKRRVIQPDFLDLLARKMKPGGKVWIRTDVGPLAEDMMADLDAHDSFAPIPFDAIPTQPFPHTTREQSIIDFGIPIHTLYYERLSGGRG